MPRAHAVVAVALVAVACGMMAEPPSNQEMTTRFRSDRAAFEALLGSLRGATALADRGPWVLRSEDLGRMGLEQATSETLRKAFDTLKLQWISGAGAGSVVVFVTWVADIPGPGHHARGFAWAPQRPPGEPRSPQRASFEEYVPVEGNWYLFEQLID